MPDLLVTGTDTGVGKTVVAAALVAGLRARGVRAVGFKPAETGVSDGDESDSARLARASGEALPLAAPLLRLAEPLAPAVAAARAGVRIEPREIEARVEGLRRGGYALVVEGAGGVMVPIAWDYTVLDLASHCGLEAVIVGRAGLGTLNHVALTAAMLRSRRIPVRGVVLNGRRAAGDLAESTNPAALARMLPDLRIVELPLLEGDGVIEGAVPYLSPLLS
ncbi:MAG: dethiobiotin synthase [Acidobacteria bacterium]|nr:dethiobiotin synthase [Acidobacteriota bacterium]